MVLVDTSVVWIRFLANRAPYAGALDALLARRKVCGHEYVFGELLIGDKGGRAHFLADDALIDRLPVVPHAEVVEFVRRRRLHGRDIGWMDAHLLASALTSHARLWTAEARLAAVACELRIDYH